MDKLGEPLLYVIRHANVELDDKGAIRGLLDAHLDEKGEAQAKELADFFADSPVSAIYVDDLARTYQTALPLADSKHIEIKKDIALRSWDAGTELEGRLIEANKARIRELKMQPWLVPVGGEAWASFEEKILRAFYGYVSAAMEASSPIALVLHGSGIQVISAELGLIEKSPAYDHTPLEPAGVMAISLSRKGLTPKLTKGAKENLDAS